MKRNHSKRLFAFLLAIAMLLSMLTASVWAGDISADSSSDEVAAPSADSSSDEVAAPSVDSSSDEVAVPSADNTDLSVMDESPIAEESEEPTEDIPEESDQHVREENVSTLAAKSGEYGEDGIWELDDAGTLTLSKKVSDEDVDEDEDEDEDSDDDSSAEMPWSSYKDLIRKVVVTKDVDFIESSAFKGYKNLEEVYVEDAERMFSVEQEAFMDCTKLSKLHLPSIGDVMLDSFAFANTGLTSVTLTGSTYLEDCVFSLCSALERIDVSSDSEEYSSVDGVLFSLDKTLLLLYPSGRKNESYSVPNGVTTITEGAFNSHYLKQVNLPSTLKMIECYGFAESTSLQSIQIPDSVDSILTGAFSLCTSLKEVKLSSNLTEIGPDVFNECSALPEITIPEGVTKIYQSAFQNCTSLKKIVIPASATNIDSTCLDGANQVIIYGYNDSQADFFASKLGLPFVALDSSKKAAISKCTITLSKSSYPYDGKAQKPSVSVLRSNSPLKQGTDYTLSYKNNTNAGTATVTITGCGRFSGTVKKTFDITPIANTITASDLVRSYSAKAQSFKLNAKVKTKANLTYKSDNKKVKVDKNGKVTLPAKFSGKVKITITAAATTNTKQTDKSIVVSVSTAPKLTKVTAKKGQLTAQWKKNKNGKGYEVQYSTDKKFKKGAKTVPVKKNSTVKTTIKKLKKGTYFVRVRTVSGKAASNWSSVKKVQVK